MCICAKTHHDLRLRQKILPADAVYQAMMCSGGLANFGLLEQKIEKKTIFNQIKGVLGFPLSLKTARSTSSSDLPSVLFLKMQMLLWAEESVWCPLFQY